MDLFSLSLWQYLSSLGADSVVPSNPKATPSCLLQVVEEGKGLPVQ
jgi:hypothetical protein